MSLILEYFPAVVKYTSEVCKATCFQTSPKELMENLCTVMG